MQRRRYISERAHLHLADSNPNGAGRTIFLNIEPAADIFYMVKKSQDLNPMVELDLEEYVMVKRVETDYEDNGNDRDDNSNSSSSDDEESDREGRV